MEDYHYDRGIAYITIAWILTIGILVAVGLRIYSRTFLTRSLGSDDFAIVIALCLSLDGIVQDTLAVKNGLGKHQDLLTTQQITQIERWSYINWIIVFISFFFVRASVMLFVLRLLPPHKKWAARTVCVTMFLNFAITMIATVSYGLSCRPFPASWDHRPGAKCQSLQIITITQQVNGILACIIDIVTAIIPQFLLWNLKMKRSTKLALNIIFAGGLITAGLSIGRVATMNEGVWATDSSWRAMKTDTFSMVEEKCGIIFASGPAIRQFFAYRKRVGSSLPTKDRQPPEQDFERFRRRVNLRDIFWYRKPNLTNGRVLRPQRLFYPPTSDQMGSPISPSDASGQRSLLDDWRSRAAHFLTGRSNKSSTRSGTGASASTRSGEHGGKMTTKLWNWESAASRSESKDAGTESDAISEEHFPAVPEKTVAP